MLLEEIKQGGVVDSTHQGLLFLLCALCPEDVLKVRVEKLSTYGIQTLWHIKDFLGEQVNFFVSEMGALGIFSLLELEYSFSH